MTEIAEFDGMPGVASKLNYNVPLPTSFTFRRVIKPTITLASGKAPTYAVPNQLPWLHSFLKLRQSGDDISFDTTAAQFLFKHVSRNGTLNGLPTAAPPSAEPLDAAEEEYWTRWVEMLRRGLLAFPRLGFGGFPKITVPVPLLPIWPGIQPAMYIVEVYGITSFAGDYGLGRTVKTFSLLPGEKTTLAVRTWRTTRESKSRSSSIIDSIDESSSDRFVKACEHEVGSSATQGTAERAYIEGEVSGGFLFVGGSSYGSDRQEIINERSDFARSLSGTVREHAYEASNARVTTVSSSAETDTETGEEITSERVIRNINLRRTLNFVFRELNQSFTTLTHLKDIRIAFSLGTPGTWNEVPLSGLWPLLTNAIPDPAERSETARILLRQIAIVMDESDEPRCVLQAMRKATEFKPEDVKPSDIDTLAEPSSSLMYRFARNKKANAATSNERDAIAQTAAPFVNGVVVARQEVTMRTDSVIVEALLGRANALDRFARAMQDAKVEREAQLASREELAQKVVADASDPAAAYHDVFCCKTEKEEGPDA